MSAMRGGPRPACCYGRGGQSALEYAVFITVVSAALVTMQLYIKRSIQANLKTVEDNINAEALP